MSKIFKNQIDKSNAKEQRAENKRKEADDEILQLKKDLEKEKAELQVLTMFKACIFLWCANV